MNDFAYTKIAYFEDKNTWLVLEYKDVSRLEISVDNIILVEIPGS